MGQTNVHSYLKPLMDRVESGQIDPSFVITHRLALADGANGYSTFDAQDGCIKVVLKP
jgi:threonine dehydrogenase-like Zn-dependent dehydrogenase